MDTGFVPIIPSQVDPHPANSFNRDSDLSPIFAEQNFFPSFYRSGHQLPLARPFSIRHNNAQTSLSGRYTSSSIPSFDESILGSGDFTVLRGGTFYADGQRKRRPSQEYFGSGSSFHESIDSSRPFALPLESPHYSDDPFANFKDFADITAGIDSDFSHFVEVYANKNSSNVKYEPKNILEQLEMIDEEKRIKAGGNKRAEIPITKPIKVSKLSKFKTKLLSTKLSKEARIMEIPKIQSAPSSLDNVDPLVADS